MRNLTLVINQFQNVRSMVQELNWLLGLVQNYAKLMTGLVFFILYLASIQRLSIV